MGEQVDALPDKMEAFDPPLIIEQFELEDPLEKKLVGELELWARDLSLVYNTYANDEFAVM